MGESLFPNREPSSTESQSRAGAAASDSESESNDSDLEEEGSLDLDDEEPETTIQKKRGKKQKKGVLLRDRIDNAAGLSDVTSPSPNHVAQAGKWKAGPDIGLAPR